MSFVERRKNDPGKWSEKGIVGRNEEQQKRCNVVNINKFWLHVTMRVISQRIWNICRIKIYDNNNTKAEGANPKS